MHRAELSRILNGRYGLHILAAGLAALLFLIFFFNPIARTMKILVAMVLFVAGNVVVKRGMRAFTTLPLEVELATLGSVVMTVAFGVKAGILTAVLSTLVAGLLSNGISIYKIMMASGYVLAAVLAWPLAPASIAAGGILIAVAVNVYLIVIFMLVGYSLTENFLYSLSNVALNAALFLKVAPWLAGLLG